MSQREFLDDIDATLHASFADAGMADVGLYTPPASPPDAVASSCLVYVDRDVQTLGDTRQFKSGRVEVVYVLASLNVAPRKHGRIQADGDSYLNDDEISNDGSLSRWTVRSV